MGKLAAKIVTGADSGVGLAAAEACEAEQTRGRGLTLAHGMALMAKASVGEVVDVFDELLAELSPAEVEAMILLMGRLVDRLETRDSF